MKKNEIGRKTKRNGKGEERGREGGEKIGKRKRNGMMRGNSRRLKRKKGKVKRLN